MADFVQKLRTFLANFLRKLRTLRLTIFYVLMKNPECSRKNLDFLKKLRKNMIVFLQNAIFPQFFQKVQIFPTNSDQNDLKTCPSRQN